MRLWFKEIIGWLIALAGIALMGVLIHLALQRAVIEAMVVSLPAAIVFRSGIGLVKLATAGRIALQAPQPPMSE